MLENFSFVIPGQLAGMARPSAGPELPEELRELREHGIAGLVSLTPAPTDPDALAVADLQSLHLPVLDFDAPGVAQIDRFVAWTRALIQRGRAVAVHCAGGMGRTGTMLGCFLVATGLSAEEAIASVRRLRPGSIETIAQEECVRRYAERMRK